MLLLAGTQQNLSRGNRGGDVRDGPGESGKFRPVTHPSIRAEVMGSLLLGERHRCVRGRDIRSRRHDGRGVLALIQALLELVLG